MNPAADAETILKHLTWRYAVKKFDPAKKIPAATWAALERSVQLSPSSYGLSPWKFLVVTTPELRQQLRPHAWNQPQITDASHLVVLCRRTATTPADIERYIQRISQVRGVAADSLADYKKMMLGSFSNPPLKDPAVQDVWASRQVYLALGFFLAAAAVLGVDACPMEGFLPEKFDEVLKLKGTGYASTVLVTAGYRHEGDGLAKAAKVRFPAEEIVAHL